MDTPISATLSSDLLSILGLSTCFPLLRWALNRIAFTPIARALLVPRKLPHNDSLHHNLALKVVKLTESQWKFFCFASLVIIGSFSTASQPWFTDTRQYWLDWPNQPITTSMQLLYCCELAYYISSIIMLAFWEVPRKDQNVMMLHHCATVVLIVFSHAYNYHRSASVIMFLHDINDVFMEVAKSCNYCGYETAATAFFAAFVASWACLRILVYPLVIIRSSIFEVREVLGFAPPAYALINTGLLLLYAINLYWFRLILRIVWAKLTTGQTRDIREEDDDDDDEHED